MAAAGLLMLLDDIAALLDDVSLMTKVAAKKTAGVLGDDLALNAQQVAGVRADRELPVVWAVAKGSLRNKCILVPAALLISAFIPALITPLLMAGGLFLCFEGFEKVAHRFLHSEQEREAEARARRERLQTPADPAQMERDRVRGAIRTDFILSAEIIVITLGVVSLDTLQTRVLVLSGIALLMTIGVYGLVAAIVKIDDLGLWLRARSGSGFGARLQQSLGNGLLRFAPWLMKALTVLGTAAMFLVGGGILVHGVHLLDVQLDAWAAVAAAAPVVGLAAGWLLKPLLSALLGLVAGGLVAVPVTLFQQRTQNSTK